MKRINILLLVSFVLAIFVFLKNAWVAEDAYINFRSVEQLFAGNGPVWNCHERVQVFTSPFWYLVLVLVRVFSSDLFLNAIVISLALWMLTVFVLKKIYENNFILLVSILLLCASSGFSDYTSSGLENVLAYLIIAIYALYYLRIYKDPDGLLDGVDLLKCIKVVLACFGLAIFVRHDLALLLLPSTMYAIWSNRSLCTKRRWSVYFVIALSPLLLFTSFSLIYYGFPFPNNAYAKLNTGIARFAILQHGAAYFLVSLIKDSITLVVIGSIVFLGLLTKTKKHHKYISLGIILNMLYVFYIGGGFMQGRFLSYAYLLSVILLSLKLGSQQTFRIKVASVALICCFLVLYPHTPLNSPVKYSNHKISLAVADERGYYFDELSLYRYIEVKQEGHVFPDPLSTVEVDDFLNSPDEVTVLHSIGVFGYCTGTKKIIVDGMALSDPLLARMPVRGIWRPGHYAREIPEGYLESIINGTEVISDPQVNEFYKKLKIVTQDKNLFSLERLKTIFMFNCGVYNHLVENWQSQSVAKSKS